MTSEAMVCLSWLVNDWAQPADRRGFDAQILDVLTRAGYVRVEGSVVVVTPEGRQAGEKVA